MFFWRKGELVGRRSYCTNALEIGRHQNLRNNEPLSELALVFRTTVPEIGTAAKLQSVWGETLRVEYHIGCKRLENAWMESSVGGNKYRFYWYRSILCSLPGRRPLSLGEEKHHGANTLVGGDTRNPGRSRSLCGTRSIMGGGGGRSIWGGGFTEDITVVVILVGKHQKVGLFRMFD